MFNNYVAYDPTSPTYLRWVNHTYPHRNGQPVGKFTEGQYTKVTIGGVQTRAHRVVWELHNGPIPDGMEIDHIDRVKSNNLLSNLRMIPKWLNMHNTGANKVRHDKRRGTWQFLSSIKGKRVCVAMPSEEHAREFAELFERELFD